MDIVGGLQSIFILSSSLQGPNLFSHGILANHLILISFALMVNLGMGRSHLLSESIKTQELLSAGDNSSFLFGY